MISTRHFMGVRDRVFGYKFETEGRQDRNHRRVSLKIQRTY